MQQLQHYYTAKTYKEIKKIRQTTVKTILKIDTYFWIPAQAKTAAIPLSERFNSCDSFGVYQLNPEAGLANFTLILVSDVFQTVLFAGVKFLLSISCLLCYLIISTEISTTIQITLRNSWSGTVLKSNIFFLNHGLTLWKSFRFMRWDGQLMKDYQNSRS